MAGQNDIQAPPGLVLDPPDQIQAPPGLVLDPLSPGGATNPLTLNIPKGPAKTQQQYESGFKDVANAAAKYAPGTLAAIGGLLQPEFGLPMLGSVAAGALLGSGVEQGTQLLTGSPQAPQSPGEAGLRAAEEVGTQEAAELGGRAIAKPIEWAAGKIIPALSRRLYQTALKPSTAAGAEEAARLTSTGLREGIPVSEKGYYAVRSKIDALNQDIANRIATQSQQLGEVIDPKSVIKELEARRPWAATQVNPEADLKALDDAKAEFLRQRTAEAPYTKIEPFTDPAEAQAMGSQFYPAGQGVAKTIQPLNLSEAQALKQGTYQRLRGSYGELGSAKTEFQKALARGLKNDIVAAYPELSNLNARESALINLSEEIEKHAVRMTSEGTGMSLPETIAGAATGHAGAGMAVGMLRRLYQNPAFRSRLALALYRAAASRTPRGVIEMGIHNLAPNQPITIHPQQTYAPTGYRYGGLEGEEVNRLARRAINRRAVLRSLGA